MLYATCQTPRTMLMIPNAHKILWLIDLSDRETPPTLWGYTYALHLPLEPTSLTCLFRIPGMEKFKVNWRADTTYVPAIQRQLQPQMRTIKFVR
jgi:hypothetical protein